MTVIAEKMGVLTPDPLGAGPISAPDKARWDQFMATEQWCSRDFGELIGAWVDPMVTNTGIRERLVAVITAPMGAYHKISFVDHVPSGNLFACLRHGEANEDTPRDLPALLQTKPNLARELFLAVRYWRNSPAELSDFDRRDYNQIIDAVKPYAGGIALQHELEPVPYVDHFITNPESMLIGAEQPVAKKEPTPRTHAEFRYKAENDPYNALALELQNPNTELSRAQEILVEWFKIVDKQIKSNDIGYDFEYGIDRITHHAVALAEDPNGDKKRLALVIAKLLERHAKKGDVTEPTGHKWLSGSVALQISDLELRAKLMQAVVLEKTPKQFVYLYKMRTAEDREAGQWYIEYLQAQSGRKTTDATALELLGKATRQYDNEQAAKAAAEAERRAKKLARRTLLYGEVQAPLF